MEFDTVSDIDKQNHPYFKVRYAKAACLSVYCKTSNNFLKLIHKGKKLEYKSYAECLKKYLDASQSVNLVTISNLQNILGQFQNCLCEEVDHNTSNSHVVETDFKLENT